MKQQKLKIKIFDKEYALLVEDEEVAKELASYVDTVMEETKNELPGQSTQTIAIIACLNIAYDLFLEKHKSKQFVNQASEKIKKIKLLLNESNISVDPS